jgi:anthranilate phosphoribosyltransferase
MLLESLKDQHGVPHDIVCLNAGAALYTAGLVGSIGAGIELARTTIASGAAREKVDAFVAATQRIADTSR